MSFSLKPVASHATTTARIFALLSEINFQPLADSVLHIMTRFSLSLSLNKSTRSPFFRPRPSETIFVKRNRILVAFGEVFVEKNRVEIPLNPQVFPSVLGFFLISSQLPQS